MLNERKKIIRYIKIFPILSIVFVSIALMSVSLMATYNYFSNQEKKISKSVTKRTISMVERQIKSLKEVSKNIDSTILNSFKREIKTAVELGSQFMLHIYKNNPNLSREELIEKIKQNFRNMKFFEDNSGYYFIYNLRGDVVLLPVKSSLEGKNLISYQDITGKYVIKDLLKIVKQDHCGFMTWHFIKPNTNLIEKKYGYLQIFKPLNLVIGSAVYYSLIKKEQQKKIIEVISQLNFHNGFSDFVILNDSGKVLYASNKDWIGKNKNKNKSICNSILKQTKNSKNKFFKMKSLDSKKLFIFNYDEDSKLFVGKIIYLDKVANIAMQQKKQMNKVIDKVLSTFVIVAIFFIGLAIFITIYLSRLIEGIFDNYEKQLIEEKEKAEIAANIKSEFLANMSHEIRTPLNAMFGFIKLLEEKETDEESQKYLSIVEKSGNNLLTIINDILDFSKLESGKFNVECIEFNPKEEIEVIHELFTSKASEKGILLEINEVNLKYNIISDPTRIKQVIANLLSNAIKFTNKDQKIEINIMYNDEIEKLYVEVIDDGIGIDENKLKTIFDAFSQADNSTTRKYGGTGLGLTISYKLVDLLGGELEVESKVGKGSKFYFEIPAKKGKEIINSIKKHKTISHKTYDYHVLLVEDNKANQMFMKVILKKMGMSFDVANDGIEAVEQFQRNKYDIILMDENMPRMNGREATKKIREIERALHLKSNIIVALTANALEGDKERFILAGMNYYLSKPLDIEKLKDIFDKIKR